MSTSFSITQNVSYDAGGAQKLKGHMAWIELAVLSYATCDKQMLIRASIHHFSAHKH